MEIRTRRVGRSRGLRLLAVTGCLLMAVGCGLLPGPDPAPTGPAPTTPSSPDPLVAPPSDFGPLAGATKGLGTGANDFDTGLAAVGDLVVASGIVYGNRLAPAFRYSTDAGATWHLGRLSDASLRDSPPDQGDQTEGLAVSTVDGQPRWLAYGSDWRQTLTWSSGDGKTWDRHVPSADQIPAEADVVDIVGVPGGFLLVGTDARDRPTAWTSTDGTTWRRSAMGGRGTPAAVAAEGSTVVSVGSHSDTDAVWISDDRGRTWQRGTQPPKPADDGHFSRYLADVTATGDGFVAIGAYFAKSWRPVVYRSRTGRTWQQQSTPPKAKGDEEGWLIRADGPDVIAGTLRHAPASRPRLWSRLGSSWREARTPLSGSTPTGGEWTLGTAVRSGRAWIVHADLSRNGQVVSDLWRSTDDGQTYTKVPRPASELNQPTALPMSLVRAGEQTYVFGDSRRRSVVWRRTGSSAFGPAALVSGAASDRVSGAVAGRPGVLTYGTRSADGTDAAVVWRQQGRSWAATAPGTFSATGRRYAASSIAQVAWLHDRWVAVGETSDNGDLNSSALVATSSDGRSWKTGRAARTMTPAGGDVWYDVTDLQGDHDRTRAMHGVAAVGDRLLAVGDSAEGDDGRGQGRTATLWRSSEARTWTMQRLPADGLAWSSMEEIVVRGSTVVVLGTGATAEGAPTLPVLWRSGDGGRTWRRQLLDPAHADGVRLESRDGVAQLVALRSGFALVGEQVDGTSRPVVLLSDDGSRWRELPLGPAAAQPGAGTVPASALADGDDLWLLLRTTNAAGAGTRLVRQATR